MRQGYHSAAGSSRESQSLCSRFLKKIRERPWQFFLILLTAFLAYNVLFGSVSVSPADDDSASPKGSSTVKDPTSIDNSHKDKFDVMYNWLTKSGADVSNIEFKAQSKTSRGTFVTQWIGGGDVICEIPKDNLMTTIMADQTPLGKEVLAKTDASVHSRLAIFMLSEKHNSDSKFKPYLDILPEEFSNVPINFGEKEIGMLTGSMAIGKIDNKKLELKHAFDRINENVSAFKFTYAEFTWARTAIITRCFGIQIHGERTTAMVPMDVVNHMHPNIVKTSWTFEDGKNAFVIRTRARKAMKSGEELLISYGRKDQSRFFVNYGFTLEGNQIDNLARLTLKIRDNERQFLIGMVYDDFETIGAFKYARYAHTRNTEAKNFSISTELKVLPSFGDAAREALAEFDTSLEDDRKILNDEKYPMHSPMRNCVVMRVSEKEVLDFFVKLDKIGKNLLAGTLEDAKQFKSNFGQKVMDESIDSYVQQVIIPLKSDVSS